MSLISHHSLAGSVRDRVKIANTQSSGVTYTQGAVNQAAVMNSASITIPVTCRSTYSLSFWLKLKSTNTGSYRQFLSCPGPGTDRSPGMWFHASNTSLHLRQSIDGVNQGADTSNLVVGSWYRVTFICESLPNNTTRLSSWLDTTLQVSTVYPGYPDYNDSPIDLLAGDYDLEDIRVYDHALCKREVIDLNQKLLSRYRLAANGHDMEDVGTLSYGAGQFLETDKGRALVLGSSFANVPLSDAPLTLKGETITFWQRCKFPRASAGGGGFTNRILQWGTYNTNNSGGFGLQSGGMSYYLRGAGASGWTTTGSISAANALYDQGDWIHYAVVFTKDDRFLLYMNGELYVDRVLAAPYTGLVSQGVNFGENMDADLMDVRFYRREVPVAEIQALYRQKLSIDGGGSVHSFSFIEKLNARYIRDWVQGSTSNAGNHWLEVRAIRDGANLSLGKPVTSNGTGSRLTKVTNGTTDNGNYAYVTGAAPAFVQVDLGSIEEIDAIQVWHYNADGRTYYGTKTEVSNDGVNWTSVFDSEFDGIYQETPSGITHQAVPRAPKIDSRGLYSPDISEIGPAGLLAWYRLNGTANDVSQYANDGAFTGTPSDLPAPSGVGLQFNGTDQYIQVPHASHLTVDPAGASYSFYVKRLADWSSSPSNTNAVLKKDDWEYGTWVRDGNVRSHFNMAGTIYYADIPYTLPLNEWVHLTVVWDGTKVLQYVNGVNIPGIQTVTGSRPLNALPLYIMADAGRATKLAMGMADVRIFSKALSSTEARLLYELTNQDHGSKIRMAHDRTYVKSQCNELVMYTAQLDANALFLKKDLILWVPGLDGVADKSGSNHPMTVHGSLGTTNHLEFRGSQWIDLPDDVGYTDQVSAFVWFRHVGSPGGNHHILFGGPQLELSVHSSGYLRSGLSIDGVREVANFTHPSVSLVDGAWHHIGFTYDGTNMRRFIDGAYMGQTSLSGVLTNTFAWRTMGRFGSHTSYWTNGDAYDYRLYRKGLTDLEVQQMYKITGESLVAH